MMSNLSSNNVFMYKLSEKDAILSNPSLQKLTRAKSRFENENFLLDITEASYENVQKIYPVMKNEVFSTKELDIDDIVKNVNEGKILNLIGMSGAGKSTTCHRLARKICSKNNSICVVIDFMKLNNVPSDKKLTLQELLLNPVLTGLNDDECKSVFQWIEQNQERLLVILDGLDVYEHIEQADWSKNSNSPKLDVDKPQLVKDLVIKLYNREYLRRCRILLTSQQHAKVLPQTSQQNHLTVRLLDLSPDNVKKLFFAFVGSKAKELWNVLHTTAPHLIKLCGNPFLLQLVVRACTKSSSNIGSITTLACLFASVLNDVSISSTSDIVDIETVLPALTELAHNLTKSKTLKIEEGKVKEVGLDLSTVHRLIISQHSNSPLKLFKGTAVLRFIHPTLQEYLSALYIHEHMSDEDFAQFAERDLFSSDWIAVRKFLFGISGQQWKKDLMKKQLLKNFNTNPEKRDLIELCNCVRECADDDVTREAAGLFPTRAVLWRTPISNSDAHALSLVLRKMHRKVELLHLHDCDLRSDSFRYISDAIKDSDSENSFDRINISYNLLSSDDVNRICDVINKVNKNLWMDDCFKNNKEDKKLNDANCRNADESEKAMIRKKLNSLQNPNLGVGVSFVGPNLDNWEILRKLVKA